MTASNLTEKATQQDGVRRVAFLGLGKMGVPMANALARNGFEVTAWSRDLPADECVGLTIYDSAPGAIDGADVIITMVFDRAAVEDVLFKYGGLAACKAGATIIDMGTTGPEAAMEHARLVGERGVNYLDAPVSGGVLGAQQSSLAIFVGGDHAVFARCRGVLEVMGKPRHVGRVGAGQTAKLANQIIVALNIASVAEGLRFAELNGIDLSAFLEAVAGGLADSAVLRQYGGRMATRCFEGGGASRLHLKDLTLVRELLGARFDKFPHTLEAIGRFEKLVAGGKGDVDHSVYFSTYDEQEASILKGVRND